MDQPTLELQSLELQRAEWSFTADLSALPGYVVLSWRGRSSAQRAAQTEALLEQRVAPRVVDTRGHFPPIIIDLSEDGQPSMKGLHYGLKMVRKFGPRFSRVVYVIDPARRDHILIRTFLSMWSEFIPANALSVADSLEQARHILACEAEKSGDSAPH